MDSLELCNGFVKTCETKHHEFRCSGLSNLRQEGYNGFEDQHGSNLAEVDNISRRKLGLQQIG